MTSPAEPCPTPGDTAAAAAAFAAGMRACDRLTMDGTEDLGGAVPLPVPGREDVWQPWSPPEPGDGGGVT
jgi:hypothetical protein